MSAELKHSLNKRYAYKLSTNLIGLAIGLITQAIIPRGLGVKAYGDFYFLTNFFTQVVNFLDLGGTSVAFYIKLSQRPRDTGLVCFYFWFSGLVFLILLAALLIAHSSSLHGLIWPHQELSYVYLAAGWSLIMWFIQVLTKMVDAYGLTVATEIARMVQKTIGLIFIVILFYAQQLSLINYFIYQYIILAFLIICMIFMMKQKGYLMRPTWSLSLTETKEYIKEFYVYCNPLVVYSILAVVVGIFDTLMLQWFGGSVEQGFYGLSFQIGAICLVFAGAMTPLLMREFTIAYKANEIGQMASLFRQYIPVLYSIAAFLSCFIAVHANMVIYFMGGEQFSGALAAVTIMALYPIHQTYGHLSGSIFYATGQTALYRNIGIIFMLLGLPVTYFLIAPQGRAGLNAGATGLAVKMVLMQFLVVNVGLYYNTRLLNLKYWSYLAHQVISVGFLLLVALVTKFCLDRLFLMEGNIVLNFLISGFVYSLIVLMTILVKPAIFGLRKADLEKIIRKIKETLRSKRNSNPKD